MPTDHHFASEHVSRVRLARVRLDRIERRRAVTDDLAAGRTLKEIALRHGLTERQAVRVKAAIAYLGDVFEVTPEEIILRATVDGTDRRELVEQLSAIRYTFGEHAPYPADGKTAGTWDQVFAARVIGHLSHDEYVEIKRAVSAPE